MSIIRHPIWQYAYFVEDIDEACRKWNQMVGAGPFHVVRHHKAEDFRYLGEPIEADVSYAFEVGVETLAEPSAKGVSARKGERKGSAKPAG